MSQNRKRLSLILAVIAAVGVDAASLAYGQQKVDTLVSKSAVAVKQSFSDAARDAAKSTVRIMVQDSDTGPAKPAALGTVVSADGFILTKGSEVLGHKKALVKLPGHDAEAQVVGFYEPYDLAMLKIEAKDLIAVVFADTREPSTAGPATAPVARGLRGGGRGRALQLPTGPIPAVATAPTPPAGAIPVEVGEFVATPDAVGSVGTDLMPKSYGVISVARREIPLTSGVLGVQLADGPGGALVTQVFMQSGAAKAGVKADDVITAVDGKPVRSRIDLQRNIYGHRPTDTVTLTLTRGNQQLTIAVQLGDTILATREDVEMAILSGSTNTRSSDFQAVFQHDTVLLPTDMGGPLVDLEGRVIGINIARAGRTETYAIPSDLITRMMDSLKDGTWLPTAVKFAERKPTP